MARWKLVRDPMKYTGLSLSEPTHRCLILSGGRPTDVIGLMDPAPRIGSSSLLDGKTCVPC